MCLQLDSPKQIEEAHPLKQGLKRENRKDQTRLHYTIEEAHPLKQGLKPHPGGSGNGGGYH